MHKKETEEPEVKKGFLLMNTGIPLYFGGLFYTFFRPDSILSKTVRRLERHGRGIGEYLIKLPGARIPAFVKNHLCDILWAYALTFACFLALGTDRKTRRKTAIICLLFEAFTESLQLSPFLPGTFDFMDIIWEASATCFSLLMLCLCKTVRKRRKDGKKENQEQLPAAGAIIVYGNGTGQRLIGQ